MKKILNNVNNVVDDMINGVIRSNSSIKRLQGFNVLVRSDCQESGVLKKVALISGGGSGHEPAHAGFIGRGMLSAAVLGDVFASPSPKQIYEAIKAVIGEAGCILIVKNYTGDRLNFGIAAEMARNQLNKRVEIVTVADDISLLSPEDENNEHTNLKRRGIAGTLLVHKCLGAAAELNYNIDQLLALFESFSINTMGVALSSCIIPAIGTPSFSLGQNEIEFGLGIHGEPGIQKVPFTTSKDIVQNIINTIIKNKLIIRERKEVVVLLNNLGTTTNMELLVICNDIMLNLNERGFLVPRFIMGTLMSAMEMAGISITLFTYEKEHSEEILKLLDYQCSSPSWPNQIFKPPTKTEDIYLSYQNTSTKEENNEFLYLGQLEISEQEANQFRTMLSRGCQVLVENSNVLTELDSKVGDGDLGLTLERVANNILNSFKTFEFNKPALVLRLISQIIDSTSGGSIGPFISIFFLRFSNTLYQNRKEDLNPSVWFESFQAGIEAIQKLGGAKQGDSTILDSLIPACNSMKTYLNENKTFNLKQLLEVLSNSASQGAESTMKMMGKAGRSQYLGERSLNEIDPGAKAISLIFNSFVN